MINNHNLLDGKYDINNIIDCVASDFASESEMCDYIERHIDLFCKDVLNVDYESHTREYRIFNRNQNRSKRIDFLITCKLGNKIIVECKNPAYVYELTQCIGQVLTYLTMMELIDRPVGRVIILATKIDFHLPFVIDRFKLPIEFIAIDKSKSLNFLNGSSYRK